MVNRPSVPEVITVNSESLQSQIRTLLPSQSGFGSELQASNVITPVIDLTSTAEGSTLPRELSSAIAFGSITTFNISSTTTVLASAPGFYRIFGVSSWQTTTGVDLTTNFQLTDGSVTKEFWKQDAGSVVSTTNFQLQFDFNVFLAPGESVSGKTNHPTCSLIGCIRQLATGDGTLVNPNGFPV